MRYRLFLSVFLFVGLLLVLSGPPNTASAYDFDYILNDFVLNTVVQPVGTGPNTFRFTNHTGDVWTDFHMETWFDSGNDPYFSPPGSSGPYQGPGDWYLSTVQTPGTVIIYPGKLDIYGLNIGVNEAFTGTFWTIGHVPSPGGGELPWGYFGKFGPSNGGSPDDLDQSKIVNYAYEGGSILIGEGASTIDTSGAKNPVPEPTTMLLLGSGLVGMAGFGRKKFKK